MIVKKLKRTSFKKPKAVMIGGLVDYILAEQLPTRRSGNSSFPKPVL